MEYVVVIPAVLACIFYVYVLVQLRRDEKRGDSDRVSGRPFERGSGKFASYRAVKSPGHSFPEWSRLAQKREAPVGSQPSRKVQGTFHAVQKRQSIVNDQGENQIQNTAKKIALAQVQ